MYCIYLRKSHAESKSKSLTQFVRETVENEIKK